MSTHSVQLTVTERIQVSNVDVDPGVYDGELIDQASEDNLDRREAQYLMDVPHSVMEIGMIVSTVRTIDVTEQVNRGLILSEE
jgi:hypothetical protein